MAMPEKYKRYISEDIWEELALHQLRPIFRESAMTILDTGLRNSGGDEQDIDVVLGLVQDYADDLRSASKLDWTGLDEKGVREGEVMAEYLTNLDRRGWVWPEAEAEGKAGAEGEEEE
jgi:hypothetical protein